MRRGGDGDSTTDVSTTDGGTTTVEPKTRTGAATAELFDDSSSCTLTVEETEGPYYFDADSIRSDIREDREGTRLRLAIRVRDADSCEPLQERRRGHVALRRARVVLGLRGGLGWRAPAVAAAPTTRSTCAAPRSPTPTASWSS